jgi:hypothetical protein
MTYIPSFMKIYSEILKLIVCGGGGGVFTDTQTAWRFRKSVLKNKLI